MSKIENWKKIDGMETHYVSDFEKYSKLYIDFYNNKKEMINNFTFNKFLDNQIDDDFMNRLKNWVKI